MNTVEWQPRRRQPRRRGRIVVIGLLAILLFGGGTALSYYVDALWFGSLGYADVFWKTLGLQSQFFTTFLVPTFLILYLAFLAIKPARIGELTGIPVLINGQPLQLPIEPIVRVAGLAGAALLAVLV